MMSNVPEIIETESGNAPAGRIGEEWLSLMRDSCGRAICGAFGLPYPIDPEGDDIAAQLALVDLGVVSASIVREPRDAPRKLHARDWDEDREIVDLAPRWRHAISGPGGERGKAAIVVPVSSAAISGPAETLSLSRLGEGEFAARLGDLIAIPLDGSRPLSFTGYTTAVGHIEADESGRLLIYGGRAWLDAHVKRAREIASETPPHLVPQLHLPFPAPDGVLLIEPQAHEWRVTRGNCVIPHTAREIVCPDSRALAATVDALMRRRERTRPLPVVRGPKQ